MDCEVLAAEFSFGSAGLLEDGICLGDFNESLSFRLLLESLLELFSNLLLELADGAFADFSGALSVTILGAISGADAAGVEAS